MTNFPDEPYEIFSVVGLPIYERHCVRAACLFVYGSVRFHRRPVILAEHEVVDTADDMQVAAARLNNSIEPSAAITSSCALFAASGPFATLRSTTHRGEWAYAVDQARGWTLGRATEPFTFRPTPTAYCR